MKNLSHIEDVKRLKAQQNQLLAAQKSTAVTQQNTVVQSQYQPAVTILKSVPVQEPVAYKAPVNHQINSSQDNFSLLTKISNLESILLQKDSEIQGLTAHNQSLAEEIVEMREDKKELRNDKLHLASEVLQLKQLLEEKHAKIEELTQKLMALEFEQFSITNNSLIAQNNQIQNPPPQQLNILGGQTVESVLLSQSSILSDLENF
jgi:chromosome segregation ATPase